MTYLFWIYFLGVCALIVVLASASRDPDVFPRRVVAKPEPIAPPPLEVEPLTIEMVERSLLVIVSGAVRR